MTKQYNKVSIPFLPRADQADLLQDLTLSRFLVAVCHRRFGKTVLAAVWLILQALSGKKEDFRGYYIAPNQKQAKRVVWSYFKKFLGNFGNLVSFNETELRIDFNHNGACIYLAGSENIEALRGVYIDAAVMDEIASWVNANYAFFEVLFPAMSDRQGRAVIIGTVKGLDLFHEFYQMGLNDEFTEWMSRLYDVESTNIFTEEEIATFRKLMTPDAFGREYMCDFYAETPDTLISGSELYSAVLREIPDSSVVPFKEVWGFDVGYTNDPSILARRKGSMIRPLTPLKDKDSQFQARWLKGQIDQYKPDIVNIDAGYGEGVIAKLNDMGYDHIIRPIFFGSKSPKPNCFNIRSYMYYEFKQWLKGGCLPKDEQLIKEASNQLLDENDADRRIKLKPKKEIKDIIGCSPDRSDAVALTFAGGDDVLSQEDLLDKTRIEDVTMSMFRDVIGAGSYDADSYIDSIYGEQSSLDMLGKTW